MPLRILSYFLLVISFINITDLKSEDLKKFTFDDVLKFRGIYYTTLSDDGKWAGYSAVPDWGDPYSVIVNTIDSNKQYIVYNTINPKISSASEWAAFTAQASSVELSNATKTDKPKTGIVILNIANGERDSIGEVASYEFSNDSRWLVYKPFSDDKEKEKSKNFKIKKLGSEIVLRHLKSKTEIPVKNVTEYIIDSTSTYIFYTKSDKDGRSDGVYYRELKEEYCPEHEIYGEKNYSFSNLKWNKTRKILAYLSAGLQESGLPYKNSLWLWDASEKKIRSALTPNDVTKNWYIPTVNKLTWSDDGKRLFFGLKPDYERYDDEDVKVTFNDTTFYNTDTIRLKSELDVWHWNDPRIKPNEKKEWKKKKNHTYLSVFHLDSAKFVQLADTSLPDVIVHDNPDFVIGYNDKPYLKEITWEGWFHDLYLVNLKTGEKTLKAKRQSEQAYLSPEGKYLLYFENLNWYLYDTFFDTLVNLTANIDYPFYNEENEVPAKPSSYGIGGWEEHGTAVYIYDEYDIWKFYTKPGGSYLNMTVGAGRTDDLQFRIIHFDPNKKFYKERDTVLLTGFHKKKKYRGVYELITSLMGFDKKLVEYANIKVLHKAKNSQRFLISKEKYDLYPDIYSTTNTFAIQRKLSNLGRQMDGYNWGTAELVDWVTPKGDSLQGFIMKPDNFKAGKKYPVLIYFYEKFSDRFYVFTMPRINHRPCFQQYVSDGYIVFMPDIKYTDGYPGKSAVDALVSGAQKLIDMGIADPKAIGIQGHSWGGYETAYIITQTDFFAAACAGAPVSNMTSAYGGIRLGSGLARQFQYEKWQSRIGGDLWDSLDNYMNNSPLFSVPNIKTPLLMLFGDKDDAVPWEQGIELYLAMRRLNKNVVFLEYRGEPHHPRKMPNKLDFAIRMKEFYDHYLKNGPEPDWLKSGKPYLGK